MFEVHNGIRISRTSFWLDATRKVPLSFISHAHSDHVRRHSHVIATPQTISLIKLKNRKINADFSRFTKIFGKSAVKNFVKKIKFLRAVA